MDRYDRAPGKESSMAKTRHNRQEAEHTANNQFVKKVQNEQAMNAGRSPNLSSESLKFNAYQCNNGSHAQNLASEITKGLDKKAFPVK